ncbi:MAG: triose-phosphate isomerase [Candidatus Micrarchaeota archaeon]
MKPVIVLNFKTFNESAGEKGFALAKAAFEVAKETRKASIVICPQMQQLEAISRKFSATNFFVFSQHADEFNPGAYTGRVTVEGIKASGCAGTITNHAERKVSLEHCRFVVDKARGLGLKTVFCAENVAKGVLLAQLKPWAIAVEPPELIGSGISVSTANPEIVRDAVKRVKQLNSSILVFVGAGVSNGNDLAKSISLGAEGVLLASAFVKAKSPKKWLEDLIDAI